MIFVIITVHLTNEGLAKRNFMKQIIKLYSKIANLVEIMTKKDDITHYNIMMGLISSMMIGVIELVSFFSVPKANVQNPIIFLISASIMFVFYIYFVLYNKNPKLLTKKKHDIVLFIYPYLIISIGIAVSFSYQGITNNMSSFLVAVFAASYIQLYPLKKRIAIFLFALIAFNSMVFITHGYDDVFADGLRFSIMISLLGYLYTMLQYRIHCNYLSTLVKLEQDNVSQQDNMKKLEVAYLDLEKSQKITEAMMTITSEILKNDDFDDVLQMVIQEAIQLIPKAQAGSILILNGSTMEFRAAFGYDIKNLQKVHLKLDELFQSTLPDKYEPAIIEDLVTFDTDHMSDNTLSQMQEQSALIAKAVLTCSFKYNEEFYGSINLDYFNSVEEYDDHDKSMIKHLAKQLEIIIAIHKLYEKAIRPTKFDDLTQAYTRNYQRELLAKAFFEAKAKNTPLSICTIDINDFKEINDQFGHDAGDLCLNFFADAIRNFSSDNFYFSRIGGDEFTLIMVNTRNEQAIIHINKIKEYLNHSPFEFHGNSKIIEFGCGVASYPEDGKDIESLLRLSDKRMYQDKNEIKAKHY